MQRVSFIIGVFFLCTTSVWAATLEIPGPGSTQSGIGVISGWKCEANGPLTVRFNGGGSIPLVYGSERSDVRDAGACSSANVGFVAIWNWGNLDGGRYTAVVYDNGQEFARSTFTVVSPGAEFLHEREWLCRSYPEQRSPGQARVGSSKTGLHSNGVHWRHRGRPRLIQSYFLSL